MILLSLTKQPHRECGKEAEPLCVYTTSILSIVSFLGGIIMLYILIALLFFLLGYFIKDIIKNIKFVKETLSKAQNIIDEYDRDYLINTINNKRKNKE